MWGEGEKRNLNRKSILEDKESVPSLQQCDCGGSCLFDPLREPSALAQGLPTLALPFSPML